MAEENQANSNQSTRMTSIPEDKPRETAPKAEQLKTDAPVSDMQQNKVWAILAYIWVLSIVVLLVKKDSAYAHYHAKQGSALFVLSVALSFVDWILPWSFGFIISLLQLGIFVLVVIGIINAASGKEQPVPIIGAVVRDMDI